MKKTPVFVSGLACLVMVGCAAPESGSQAAVERGPHGTAAYMVLIESSEPGVRIETNKVYAGNTPLEIKIFGDRDGTFHFFGTPWYMIRAVPVKEGQNQQTKLFRTGDDFTGEDKIPKRIIFDMADPDKTRVEGTQAPLR